MMVIRMFQIRISNWRFLESVGRVAGLGKLASAVILFGEEDC
ncbi:hypothetical protein HanHA89_Chr12g0452311 [Helianthus annuus]|nr:hypothetical protein HanHA89_Chr12g0452311 [Helianthus annuus]